MSQQATTANKKNVKIKPLAIVIAMRSIRGKAQHAETKKKVKKELPLFYTEPIFKAKKHDPL